MKKIAIWILIVLGIIVLGGVVMMISSNPLRRSTERIREDVLELTPIGSSMEEVMEAIGKNSRWREDPVIYDRGYGIMRAGPEYNRIYFPTIYYFEDDITFVKAVGVQTIRLDIGNYHNPLSNTFVLVHWAFDANGELIDIAIDKEVSSL